MMIPLEKAKIVVIDDDAIVTRMIVSTIEEDYRVTAFSKGRSALEHIESLQPHLILLDVLLGDDNGYDICRILKANPRTKDIPVVFLSSLTDAFDKVKAFETGAADYVTKPIQIAELKMRMETHITSYMLKKDMEKAVQRQTQKLQEANEALRSLLANREAELRATEETIVFRVKDYIHPYLNKLERARDQQERDHLIKIIRSNLNELVPSADNQLSANYLKLSPAEVKVADLVRQGKQTKQIAEALRLSTKSVYFYRNSIRKKLGLLNKKINLATYLNSLIHEQRRS